MKKLIKLNVILDMIIGNVKNTELNTKIASDVLNMQTLKKIWNTNIYVVNGTTKKRLTKI